jgi:hypothetical protein
MSNTIVLNLSKIDFDDNFNIDNGEVWQKQAGESLVKNLVTIANQAKEYSERRKTERHQQPQAMHDAIFISGGRGAGKTVFLKNAQEVWGKAAESKGIPLYFAPAIDPTLLINHDNFTNVVVAHLYNEVEKAFNKPCKQLEIFKTDFYSKLKELADSLGQESDYEDRMGIDRILKYRSGIQVERFFHDYVEVCANILASTAIVIPIDDVDMALGRAYEVLDVVRRMLGCPFIIPLISGDEALYQHMVKQHFLDDAISKNADAATTKNAIHMADRLKDAYLTKVLPNQHRISLLSVENLLASLEIEEFNQQKTSFYSPYGKSYDQFFKNCFFGLSNGQERSTDYPLPSNARDIVQLIRLLPPTRLKQIPGWSEWESLKIWATTNRHGATYTNAVSAQQLLTINQNTEIRMSQLLAFNPIAQSLLRLDWADKDFEAEQESALNQISDVEAKNTNRFVLKGAINSHVLRSMPPLEMHTRRMTISNNAIKEEKIKNSVLFNLYTHRDYYGSQGSQTYKVFFSRAFEILGSSLLMLNINLTKTYYDNIWIELLNKILSDAPFYCIHAINPTKYTTQEEGANSDEIDEVDEEVAEQASKYGFEISFAQDLATWSVKHSIILSLLQRESLLPLLHAVFNKVFTQLHLLRINHNKLEDEHLSDTARRFEYIVINAFATFLKKSGVVKANLASSARSATIRNHSDFINKEHVFTRNVGVFVDLKSGVYNGDNNEDYFENPLAGKLIAAIWDHPIFSTNHSRTDDLKPLGAFEYKKTISLTKSKEVFDRQNDKSRKLEKMLIQVKADQAKAQAALIAKQKQSNRRLISITKLYRISGVDNLSELIAKIRIDNDDEFTQMVRSTVMTELNTKRIDITELSSGYRELCEILGIGSNASN